MSSQMKVIDQSYVNFFDMVSYYGGIFFVLSSILAFLTSYVTIDSMLSKVSDDKQDVREKVSFNGLYKLF